MIERKAIGERLLKNNIKPSFPRLRVMEYLVSERNHPTVDEIYRVLAEEIPTLSKTTIYNTLGLFEDAGLVRRVPTGDNEARYDAFVEDHGHFQCESCKAVFDFSVRLDQAIENGLETFEIRKKDIYYQGLCPQCRGGALNN